MNRNIRTIVITAALLFAVAFAVPGVSAAEGEGDDDDDENTKGEKFCRRVIGINACVAVLYGDCTLWASAIVGGCWVQGGSDDPFLNTA